MRVSVFENCYDDNWNGLIVPEAFSHPAKFSPGLIRRIYKHCLEMGYLRKGELVLDCFGGIGAGGIMAAPMGLRWLGCELEEKFVTLANQNFDLHRRSWETMGYPQPVILQGDSRELSKVLSQCDALVTSPPHGDTFNEKKQGARQPEREKNLGRPVAYGCSNGNIGNLKSGNLSQVLQGADYCVTSPPHGENRFDGGEESLKKPQGFSRGYSAKGGYADNTFGQIGNLKSGDLDSVIQADLVCTSPPYAETALKNDLSQEQFERKLERWAKVSDWKRPRPTGNMAQPDYGHHPGQIGNMKAGDVEAVITSPPYAESIKEGKSGIDWDKSQTPGPGRHLRTDQLAEGYSSSPSNIGNLRSGSVEAVVTSPPYEGIATNGGKYGMIKRGMYQPDKNPGTNTFDNYGQSPGQLGQTSGDTYWQAVADVYRECHKILKPQGIICVVVKSYVKQGRRVPLPMQTLKLLIHLGFEPLERIKAMLVKEEVHNGLFGEIRKVKARKSFFRRLAESKGSPKIDWEEVLIFRKKSL